MYMYCGNTILHSVHIQSAGIILASDIYFAVASFSPLFQSQTTIECPSSTPTDTRHFPSAVQRGFSHVPKTQHHDDKDQLYNRPLSSEPGSS